MVWWLSSRWVTCRCIDVNGKRGHSTLSQCNHVCVSIYQGREFPTDKRFPAFLIVSRTFLGSVWIHWEMYGGGRGVLENLITNNLTAQIYEQNINPGIFQTHPAPVPHFIAMPFSQLFSFSSVIIPDICTLLYNVYYNTAGMVITPKRMVVSMTTWLEKLEVLRDIC